MIKAGGIMDVVECYPWTGEVLTHGRRDKRKGVHTGRVVRTEEGSPSIQYVWWWRVYLDTFVSCTHPTTHKHTTTGYHGKTLLVVSVQIHLCYQRMGVP